LASNFPEQIQAARTECDSDKAIFLYSLVLFIFEAKLYRQSSVLYVRYRTYKDIFIGIISHNT
jgi:hypothetical protein